MRIVTRADFDGVVCAALLSDAEDIDRPILWVEPNEMQKGRVPIQAGDIIANLPFHPACAKWFDHHVTNQVDRPFEGRFAIAPSAAGLIFDYYDKSRFGRDYSELVAQTDRIDAADLSMEEVRRPEDYPHVLLSMTIASHQPEDEPYWNELVALLRRQPIAAVMAHPEVKQRCERAVSQNRDFEAILRRHTRVDGPVAITDFRDFDPAPSGNRFLVYCLFPRTLVSVKVRYESPKKDKVIVGAGHSIFHPGCQVNVGVMLSRFGGGGHRGAGSCTVPAEKADDCIREVVATLKANQKND